MSTIPIGSCENGTFQGGNIISASSTFKPQTFVSRLRDPSSKAASKAIERQWSIDLHEEAPVLTAKALLAGLLVGLLCSFLSMYYSLKLGVIPSLNILSGLGGYLLVKAFLRLRLFRGQFTPQENAVVQTAAVAAYATSATSMGFGSAYLAMSRNAWQTMGGDAFPGNRETDSLELTWIRSFLWTVSLGFFGFFIAFPIRDYMIVKQRLPFPSGTVTAFVIKSMHNAKAKTTEAFALLSKFFAIAFAVNMFTWLYSGMDSFPFLGSVVQNKYDWSLDFDLGSYGIGAILPLTVSWSMLLGCIMQAGLLMPLIEKYRSGNGPNDWLDMDNLPGGSVYLGSKAYCIYGGLGMMLTCGAWELVELFIILFRQWWKSRSTSAPTDLEAGTLTGDRRISTSSDDIEDNTRIVASVGPSKTVSRRSMYTHEQHASQSEVLLDIFVKSTIPSWIPYVGYTILGALCILVLDLSFKTRWYQTLVALMVIPIFAFVNAHGTGNTDWDMGTIYGKLMMFPFGAWNHGTSIIPSLALCCVTVSGCSSTSSLLQDFKTGMLVGAPPTSMFYAQIMGTIFGCFIAPSLFALLYGAFPLPSKDTRAFIQGRFGTIYRTLAVVAAGTGFSALPKHVLEITLGFIILTLVLKTLEHIIPSPYVDYLPDASSLSIGMLVPPSVGVDFCMGALVAWWWHRWSPESAASQLPNIVSGCVAGSGFGTLIRCLLALANFQPPVILSYKDAVQNLSGGTLFLVALLSLVSLAVILCGCWFWNQTTDTYQPSFDEVYMRDEKLRRAELQTEEGSVNNKEV